MEFPYPLQLVPVYREPSGDGKSPHGVRCRSRDAEQRRLVWCIHPLRGGEEGVGAYHLWYRRPPLLYLSLSLLLLQTPVATCYCYCLFLKFSFFFFDLFLSRHGTKRAIFGSSGWSGASLTTRSYTTVRARAVLVHRPPRYQQPRSRSPRVHTASLLLLLRADLTESEVKSLLPHFRLYGQSRTTGDVNRRERAATWRANRQTRYSNVGKNWIQENNKLNSTLEEVIEIRYWSFGQWIDGKEDRLRPTLDTRSAMGRNIVLAAISLSSSFQVE